MDNLSAIELFHKKYNMQKQCQMLLLMAGVTDHQNAKHADTEALNSLMANLFISTEFQKLLNYLRS